MKNSRFVKFEKFEKFVRRVPFITLPFDYPRLIAGLFSNGYACIIDQNIRFLSMMKHFNSCRDVICHVFHGLPAIVRRFTWISKSNDSSAWTIIALFCNNSFILSWTGLHGEFVDRSNKLKNIACLDSFGVARIVLLSCFYLSTDSINGTLPVVPILIRNRPRERVKLLGSIK